MARASNAYELSQLLEEKFQPTPQQQAVIEADLTPALVIAGAGSGKTTTMADRVAWLVYNGMNPEDILGLTFTRKAAHELSARVHTKLKTLREKEPQQFAEGAEFFEPQISTYNSFANGIFRDNALMVGREPESILLDEVAAWSLARRVILESDDEDLIVLDKTPEYLAKIVTELSQQVTQHLVNIDDLDRFAEAFHELQNLTPKEGFPKQGTYKWIRDKIADLDALPVLARLIRRYQQVKRERNLVEYADQVALALEVVSRGDRNPVAESLRERFRVVLLDEYQDTSVVESLLLSKLFSGSAVMAVGDPHQSIYGWRGASASNLSSFRQQFGVQPDTPNYSLTISWRNDKKILEAANLSSAELREHSVVPVGILDARPGAAEGTIDSFIAETDTDEAARVAEWFAERIQEHPSTGTDTPAEMAILFRVKKSIPVFAQALKERGIPYEIVGLGGLVQLAEVQDVISALRVIQDPHAGSALIRLLAGGKWRIGVKDLQRLKWLAGRLSRYDDQQRELPPEFNAEQFYSQATEAKYSIIDALDFIDVAKPNHQFLSRFSAEALERFRDAAGFFAQLRRLASVLSIPELIQQIIEGLNLDIELAANETRVSSRNLVTFKQAVQGYIASADRVDAADLDGLLSWLDQAEDSDKLKQETPPAAPGAVQLLTVHSAKGLEWDYVAIPRMTEGSFPSSGKQDASGWVGFGRLPYELRKDRDQLPVFRWRNQADQHRVQGVEWQSFVDALRERHLSEERRLAYVAITRARTRVLMSASWWSGMNVKPTQIGVFYQELAEQGILAPVPESSELTENPQIAHGPTITWPLDPLGSRRVRVEQVAQAFRELPPEIAPAPALQHEIEILLAEARKKRSPDQSVELPNRIPASRFKDFIADPKTQIDELIRPMPQKPYTQTRLGTRFHTMVEHQATRMGQQELFDSELFELDETADDYLELHKLTELKANFDRSEWGGIQPEAVELEIHVPLAGKIVVCKIDAVYRAAEGSGYRYQVVDWKTGKAPNTDAELADRLFQIHLYRLAFAELQDIPLEDVDAVLYYVAEDRVIRASEIVDRQTLTRQWHEASA